MLIKEIMTTRVATVSMDDRLGVIKEIFQDTCSAVKTGAGSTLSSTC